MNVDGSEDTEIYCLKDGEVAALAAPATTVFTRKLLQGDGRDEEDNFANVDKEDKGELEQSKVVICADNN